MTVIRQTPAASGGMTISKTSSVRRLKRMGPFYAAAKNLG